MSDASPEPCRNCGHAWHAPAPPRYCPQCGQETALHPPRLGEFVHEFVGHYVALEGALWRTLGALLLRPGRLTREYLAGRRRRYVLPLRLYLSASFVFFVVVKLLGAGALPLVQVGLDAQSRPLAAGALAAHRDDPQLQRLLACDAAGDGCSWIERRLAYWIDGIDRGTLSPERLGERFMAAAPYALFLMLPAFAGFVAWAYRRRGLPYGAHFVFSLHMHSFWFVALLALAFLPEAVHDVATAAMAGYALWALRHVYGGRWRATLARAAAIGAGYGLVMMLCTTALVLAALASR